MKSRALRVGLTLLLLLLAMPAIGYAQFESPNYEVNEIFIGTGGDLESCSTNFCAQQSTGGTAVGNTQSANFQADGGFGTPDEEVLEMSVSNTSIDLGVLIPSTTSAASSNFSVKNYISNGYVVKIYGDPPTYVSPPSTSQLDPLNSPSLSQPGTEQFGVNLVANTTPGIGANPIQVPSSDFSYGEAAVGYNTPDYFKYVDGDTIAQSVQSSGQTDYTISIIANISTNTPGGRFQTTLVLVAIATF